MIQKGEIEFQKDCLKILNNIKYYNYTLSFKFFNELNYKKKEMI